MDGEKQRYGPYEYKLPDWITIQDVNMIYVENYCGQKDHRLSYSLRTDFKCVDDLQNKLDIFESLDHVEE